MTISQDTKEYSDPKEWWSSEDNEKVMGRWGTDGGSGKTSLLKWHLS